MARTPIRVLFLCTRNSSRSQLAEALLVQEGGDRFDVASAGATPAMEVDPMTFEVLDQLGIDWRAHRPKGFEAVQNTEWDLVVTVCDRAREACPVLPGRPAYAHLSLADPSETVGPPDARRRAFVATAEHLQRCIRRLLDLPPSEMDPERMALSFTDPSGVAAAVTARVLFLCTANAARSQIAEALLTRKGGDRFVVASAGTHPGHVVHPEAVRALAELGIDWSGRRPKSIDTVMQQPWDLVITLCDRTRETCATLPTRPVFAHWGVPDPAEVRDLARRSIAFRDALALIAWRLDLMLALRPEALDRLVLAERLRAIGASHPDSRGPQ
jgi:arsenate reductase